MSLLVCLLLFLPKILFGFALAHRLWDDLDLSAIVLKFALGIPLGLAISSSLFYVAIMMGMLPRAYSLIEFGGALLFTLFYVPRLFPRLKNIRFFSGFSWQTVLSAFILLAGTGLLLYAFWFYSRLHPYGFEDAWSIWNFTSRFIYRTNSPAILLDNQFYDRVHPDYPPGLSLNVALGWLVLNRETTSLPIAVALLVTVAPAMILWGALKKWKDKLSAALGTLVFMMSPNLHWSIGQMADSLIALHILAVVVLLYGYLHSQKPGLLLLAGLLTGFSAWAKNEGILFIVVFVLICGAAALRRLIHWNALKLLGIGLIPAALVVSAHKIINKSPNDLFSGDNSFSLQLVDLRRWQLIGQGYMENIIRYGNWPISVVIVLLAYLILMGLDSRESRRHIWLLLIVAMQLAGYFGIYLITPHDLDWHIYTSMERLVSHLFPAIFFLTFIASQSPRLERVEPGNLASIGEAG